MTRKTRQKEAIRLAFEKAARPLSPQEALAVAQDDVPGLGIATIYRTIRDLVEKGELIEVELPGNSLRYELHGKEHHHHFLCRVCDRVFEIDACDGRINVGVPRGFKTERHEVVLHGLCGDCSK